MAFNDKNYIWEAKILSRRPALIELLASDELVGDIEEGSCVWPSEWLRVWCDGVDQGCDEVMDNNCDEQIEEEEYDWEEVGDYDLTPLPEEEEEEEERWRQEWRDGPLAAMKVFAKIVDDEAKWGALARRFPALRNEWEEEFGNDPRWGRLKRLMDPPRILTQKLPLNAGRHYGAWQKWKGARDSGFSAWIIEFDWAQSLVADDLFEEVAARLARGYFDI